MWKTFQGSPNPFSTSYKSVLSVLNRTCLTQANKTKTIKKFMFHSKLQLCGKKNIGKHERSGQSSSSGNKQTFHSLLFYILTLQKEVWEVCFTKKTRVIGYASQTLIKYHLHSVRIRVLGFKMGNHRTIFEIISFMPPSFKFIPITINQTTPSN